MNILDARKYFEDKSIIVQGIYHALEKDDFYELITLLQKEQEARICENCKHESTGRISCNNNIPRPDNYNFKGIKFGCNRFEIDLDE